MPKLVPIVNLKDEVIGTKEKRACLPTDITRATGLFLYTPKREVLLAKRAMTKWYDPGKWSFGVAGTVEAHETYLSNILKETEEEIGLTLREDDLRQTFYGYFETTHRFFYAQYAVEINLPLTAFTKQDEEVDELRYVPAEELFEWLDQRPADFVVNLSQAMDLVRKALKW